MAREVLRMIPRALAGMCWLNHAERPRFGRNTTAHSHREVEANLVASGGCRYLIDGRTQDLVTGDLYWLFPDQEHMIIEWTPDLTLWIAVARPDFLARRLPEFPARAAGALARPCRLDEGERAHLTGVAAALAGCEDDPVHHADGLAWWFRTAWRISEAAPGRIGRVLHPAVLRALSLLGTDPSRPLPALARDVHLSASRLSHLFADQVGRSISAHRNHVRLSRFQEEMQSGRCRTITEAAFEAGFGSYAQFARVLQAQQGLGPRSLARAARR